MYIVIILWDFIRYLNVFSLYHDVFGSWSCFRLRVTGGRTKPYSVELQWPTRKMAADIWTLLRVLCRVPSWANEDLVCKSDQLLKSVKLMPCARMRAPSAFFRVRHCSLNLVPKSRMEPTSKLGRFKYNKHRGWINVTIIITTVSLHRHKLHTSLFAVFDASFGRMPTD